MGSALKNIMLGIAVGIASTGLIAMALYFSLTARPSQPRDPSPGTVTAMAEPPTVTHTPTPAPTTTASITPTATFTPIPTLEHVQYVSPTVTPSITPTIDVVQAAIDGGALSFTGPLSDNEQMALYRASLKYAQTTVQDSKRVSKEINGVGYGDPSNICGPLAVVILRDAGLMDTDIVPHDFWLLNPLASIDEQLLEKAFPRDRYIHAIIPTAINKVDWHATPLMPGDFIFIWHGSWGNFDHMLVVNRVDKAGRAYAVTNYGTEAGYVIAEAMLYDPADPTLGLFRQWTKERDAILGSTGFGGYELWRLRSP